MSNDVYLDCSSLHDIHLRSELPNSILIDGQHFIDLLNDSVIGRTDPQFIKIWVTRNNNIREVIINCKSIISYDSDILVLSNNEEYVVKEKESKEKLTNFLNQNLI